MCAAQSGLDWCCWALLVSHLPVGWIHCCGTFTELCLASDSPAFLSNHRLYFWTLEVDRQVRASAPGGSHFSVFTTGSRARNAVPGGNDLELTPCHECVCVLPAHME